jgi:hypothetical protein
VILFDQAASEYAVTDATWTPPTTNGTVCFWFYYTQENGINNWHFYHSDGTYCRMNGSAIEIALSRQAGKDVYYSLPFATNTMYHLASTYYDIGNKRGMDIWVNGTNVVSGDSANAGTPGTATTAFSWDKGTNYFYGALMDFRWYSRVLSDDEIQAIYAMRGTDDILQGLLHRWPMTGGADGTSVTGTGAVRDWVGELHATPANTPTWEIDNPLKWRKIA